MRKQISVRDHKSINNNCCGWPRRLLNNPLNRAVGAQHRNPNVRRILFVIVQPRERMGEAGEHLASGDYFIGIRDGEALSLAKHRSCVHETHRISRPSSRNVRNGASVKAVAAVLADVVPKVPHGDDDLINLRRERLKEVVEVRFTAVGEKRFRNLFGEGAHAFALTRSEKNQFHTGNCYHEYTSCQSIICIPHSSSSRLGAGRGILRADNKFHCATASLCYHDAMCGITGFVGRGDEQTLHRMVSTIKHRGPDHQGAAVVGQVGLGSTRLAILDRSAAGNQPMTNERGTVRLVFNGEIYNFKELRAELLPRFSFRSRTDTEVILRSYEAYGEKCFERLHGMFAIAIHDVARNLLFLARDRMGKKPLYVGEYGDTFLFGSEVKALREHSAFRGEIDREALREYVQYEYVPTPRSIFRGVRKVSPGSYLRIASGSLREETFWQPSFTADKTLTLSGALRTLDTLLAQSVAERLVADVPVGIFLSGGIDSSAVAYYAVAAGRTAIESFSIGFGERSFNESREAHAVATALGTTHREATLTASDALALLPGIAATFDEPIGDVSVIPTYFLSQFARRHVVVALGGDGADELFAGYPTFQADRLADVYRFLPRLLRKGVESLVSHLPSGTSYFSFDFKLRKFLEGADAPRRYRHARWLGSFPPEVQGELFREPYDVPNPFVHVDERVREASDANEAERTLYLYQRGYLMDEVLVKLDRATMAHALEVRSPFLATSVVEFANRLPYHFKLRGMTTKYLLKKLMKGRLPAAIISRRKQGFTIPLALWLRGPFRELATDVLSPARLAREGFFNPSYVERLLAEHLAERANHAKRLWTLLAFELWYERWGRGGR
ncbi:MAG: asparagine synthase [Parcubacteria group bacterium Gr01-1014_72]|nr:MAG: asparagine synthase [Parcubacteria group bacterium Gr01-1014_72]